MTPTKEQTSEAMAEIREALAYSDVSYPKEADDLVTAFITPHPSVELEWDDDYLMWNGHIIGSLSLRDWRVEGGWMVTLCHRGIGHWLDHAEARTALETAARAWLSPVTAKSESQDMVSVSRADVERALDAVNLFKERSSHGGE